MFTFHSQKIPSYIHSSNCASKNNSVRVLRSKFSMFWLDFKQFSDSKYSIRFSSFHKSVVYSCVFSGVNHCVSVCSICFNSGSSLEVWLNVMRLQELDQLDGGSLCLRCVAIFASTDFLTITIFCIRHIPTASN